MAGEMQEVGDVVVALVGGGGLNCRKFAERDGNVVVPFTETSRSDFRRSWMQQ